MNLEEDNNKGMENDVISQASLKIETWHGERKIEKIKTRANKTARATRMNLGHCVVTSHHARAALHLALSRCPSVAK